MMRQLTFALAGLALLVVATISGCITQGDKIQCTAEDRAVETCYTLHDPVCGYSSPVTFKTYTNDCMACLDPAVDYYIEGACLIN